MVEQNRDAPAAHPDRSIEGGVDPAKLVPVLRYDGSPITARFITDEIATGTRSPLATVHVAE